MIKNPGWSFDFILNNGKHLMDLKDGRLGVGATFEWKELDHKPTEKGKEELLAHLEKNFNYSNAYCFYKKNGKERDIISNPFLVTKMIFAMLLLQ